MSAPASSKPPRGILACYYAVQFGKTILWVAADLIAFYVLATVDRLPAQDVALVLMGGLAWHAVSDMAVGQWLERCGGDARRLATIAGLSVPVACGAFVASLLLAPHRPWTALAAMMVSRGAYALFDVPHHALLGRMARRGWPAVRIVGIRNLAGQIAVLILGLGLAPALDPTMTHMALALVLVAIAIVAALSSMPVVLLLQRLWEVPAAAPLMAEMGHASIAQIATVLTLHLSVTLLVATTSKVTLTAVVPGLVLATVSAGRIAASLPLHARWREQHIGVKLGGATLCLLVVIALLRIWPNPATLFGFGLTSGWVNILTWAWFGRATNHPRAFGLAVMLSKIGLLVSIPVANTFAPADRNR